MINNSPSILRSDMISCALCKNPPCSQACAIMNPGELLRSIWFRNEQTAAGRLPEDNPCLTCEGACEKACVRAGEVPVPPFAAPSGIIHSRFTVNGVKLETLSREGASGGRAVLQLHGGGYILPLTDLYRIWGVMQLDQAAAGTVFMADYRTAPAHKYPAALEDALAAYRYILEQGFAAGDIVVMGIPPEAIWLSPWQWRS